MSRRWLVLLGVLGVGATAVGLWGLHRTFAAEHVAARAAVTARRAAVEEYAQAAMAQTLTARTRANSANIDRAATDPLWPGEGLLLWQRGQQILPRQAAAVAGDRTPARALYSQLVGRPAAPTDPSATPAPAGDAPWNERLRLRRALFDALAANDADAIAQAFRGILAASVRFVLPAERDVPFMLAMLTRLVEDGRPDPGLLRMVLHAGVPDGQGGRLESIQRRLLRRRDAFTQADFTVLADQIIALATPASVPVDAFKARVREAGPALSAGEVVVPSLLPGGWYVLPTGEGARGVRVATASLLQSLTARMRGRSLLGSDYSVTAPDGLVGPVHRIRLKVASPEWARALKAADDAWFQKALLLWVTGALALGLIALVMVDQARRRRFLALKSDFVSTVSHELRTPLASIRLMGETLERRFKDAPRAKDYPSRIVRAADDMAFLVENILSFNRLDKGRWVARVASTSLNDVLQAARDKVVSHAAKPLQWRVEGESTLSLQVDSELIELMLVNLARNAVQYAQRSPVEVTIGVERTAKGGLQITVADNGPGMAPDVAKRVFAAFFRAPSSAGTRGSGLGLAICQKIMALHRGNIAVAEAGPDGTTFALRFPKEVIDPCPGS
ncbi:MAG: two-component system sensor histidine kinase SenX3 [Bradymonadia bacterium]|jgi:two-component system sensor histidine kinase SenX3